MIGETDRLPKQTFEALTKAEELTKNNTGLILNFALNYGGRAEITQALKLISQDVLDAKINPGDITRGIDWQLSLYPTFALRTYEIRT